MADSTRGSAESGSPLDRSPLAPDDASDLLRVLGQPWLITFLVLHGAGWWIYQQQVPVEDFSLLAYTVSATASLAFWVLVQLLRDWLDTIARFTLGIVLAVVVMFMLVAQYETFVEFGEFMSASMVSYAGKGGVSTFAHYIETYLTYPLSVVFYTGIPAMAAVWAFGPDIALPSKTDRRRVALGAGLVFLVGLAGSTLLANKRHIAIDISFATASIRTQFMPTDDRLDPSNRRSIEATPRESSNPPNVVVLLNESFGVHEVDLSDDEIDGMPFLEPWIRRTPERTVVFERAYANSTSTDVSVPSLMTGVGPERPVEQLQAAPMLWDWARGAGLAPFYASSQNYYSTQFPEFFFAGDSMPVLRPNTFEELDRKGDFSVDEIFAADQFGEQLRKMPDDSPIFAVYNTNAMHKPFQQTSPRLDEQPEKGSRYENALYILDRALKRTIEALERDGRLENTLFVMTSDHGEHHERRHALARVLSVYEEFTRVPMVVRVPADWPETRPETVEALRSNADRNVANVDVAPTLVDALDYPSDAPALTPLRDLFSGHSLLEPIPRDRFVYVLNNNPLRHWEHQSFGIYWKNWRFLFSDIEGPQLFDISRDPHQQNDRWSDAPKPERSRVLDRIRDNAYLSDIWTTAGPGFSR